MDDSQIAYAVQNTRVLYVPERRIDSFGDTRFDYCLLAEPMDSAGHCRLRTGWIEATRPRILRPADMRAIESEGFQADLQHLLHRLQSMGVGVQALLKYGFRFSRSEVQTEYLHEDIREVADRVVRTTRDSGDTFRAVIQGVDDAWEVSLVTFMIEMIQQSHEINIFDYKRRGLL